TIGILEDKHQIVRRISMIAHFKKASGWPIVAVSLFVALSVIGLTDAEPGKSQTKTPEQGVRLDPKQVSEPDGTGASAPGPRFHGKSCEEWFEQIIFGKGK